MTGIFYNTTPLIKISHHPLPDHSNLHKLPHQGHQSDFPGITQQLLQQRLDCPIAIPLQANVLQGMIEDPIWGTRSCGPLEAALRCEALLIRIGKFCLIGFKRRHYRSDFETALKESHFSVSTFNSGTQL
ncbi:hypothetical protein AVEN_107485-1 [Araneus ventricosus]|uniref:Uncharacterized protein n=1 Tax=Araneus ventricosus TaxID=182803 RepID=A0A4Y2SYB5_ARAVE|nr:hypothetical protein AVEN_107485-1 [Araneus ventricosus]